MTIRCAARCSRPPPSTLNAITLSAFLKSPYLVEHLRTYMPDTEPHTDKGWHTIAAETVRHLPHDDDDTYLFVLDLVMLWPDAKSRRAWLMGQAPDDTRYIAFRIKRGDASNEELTNLIRTLVELGEEALTEHVLDALYEVIERDERPSFYKAPLALLSELNDVNIPRRLTHIASQTHHTRRKHDAIHDHVALIYERMNVYGGALIG